MTQRKGSKDPGGSAGEQKGRAPRLPLPDDSRDFGQSRGDTDLHQGLEELEQPSEERTASGAPGSEHAVGGQQPEGGREEAGEDAESEDRED